MGGKPCSIGLPRLKRRRAGRSFTAVAAVLLGAVKREIGLAQHVFKGVLRRGLRYAYAQRDVERLSARQHDFSSFHFGAQPLRRLPRLLRIGLPEQQTEFFPAYARD